MMALWAIDITVGDHPQYRTIPIGGPLVIAMPVEAAATVVLAAWLRWRLPPSSSAGSFVPVLHTLPVRLGERTVEPIGPTFCSPIICC